jgi:hypothetical protein
LSTAARPQFRNVRPLIGRFADMKPGFGDNRLHLRRAAARKWVGLEGPTMPCARPVPNAVLRPFASYRSLRLKG